MSVKGYKIFNPDWTCQGKQYVMGRIAKQDGELEMCMNGLHFCRELADCFYYYSADPRNRLAEVEAVGEVLFSERNSKCCTDELKLIREISIAELLEDADFCLEILKRVPKQIRFMEGRGLDFYMRAIQKAELMLMHVPEDMRTSALCLAAVKQNGWALEDVPEALKTPKLCLAAVQQNGRTLRYMPEDARTFEICLAAVEQDGSALEYVPKALKTRGICLAAVRETGPAIQYVPEESRTPELCLTAVQHDGGLPDSVALQYVPEERKTPELCLAAVQQSGRVLQYVPEMLRTPQVCLAAVQRWGGAFKYVPKEQKTLKVRLTAMMQSLATGLRIFLEMD